MSRYRSAWLIACAGLAMIGVGRAAKMASGDRLAPFLAFTVLCSLVALCAVTAQERRLRDFMRTVSTGALVGGITTYAAIGWAGILGVQYAFLVGLFVLAISPYAVRTYWRWLRSVPAPSAAQLEAFARAFVYTDMGYISFQAPPDPRALTDEQLRQGWRDSYEALRQRSSVQMMRAIEDRQAYLDEFERRNPSGLAAWLASDARTTDIPLPYVDGTVRHATINWDELTREPGR